MKLIRHIHLIQDVGNTQRIHEIDLCEVSDGKYVINFRYGRSGRRMQEGSLTTLAVDRSRAEKIYEKAVRDKTKKGYYDPASPQHAAPKKRGPRKHVSQEEAARKRSTGILARLRGGDGMYPEWPLNRAIWRAGELALSEAAPEILRVLCDKTSDALRRYVSIWALGNCGGPECIQRITECYEDKKESKANRRIAAEALLRLLPQNEREQLIATETGRLPASLQTLAQNGPADAFATELDHLSQTGIAVYSDTVYTAYIVNNDYTRPAVIRFCQTTPVDSDGFSILRALYKAAEYRLDGQIFGLLSHKFETSSPAGYPRFSRKTKNYYRWRAWRTLRRLGQLGHPEWVKMAVGTLAPFSTKDSHNGSFSTYWAFNHLLYHNSRVYRPDKTQSFFFNRRTNQKTGQSAFNEEAFPELWDEAPFALLHLIEESELAPVHTFAVRALKRNTDFLAKIDDAAIAMLLLRPIEATAIFGLELFKKRGDTRAEDTALFLALAESVHKPARELAWRCIDRHRGELIRDSALWVAIAFSRHQDTRQYLKKTLKTALLFSDVARLVVGRLIARLLGETPKPDVFADVAELLLKTLASHTTNLGIDVIRDLLGKSDPLYQELAGELLLLNPTLARNVPSDILFSLLSGTTEAVRSTGVALLNGLTTSDLVQRPELFFNLVVSPHHDLRTSVRALIARIASTSSTFTNLLGELFFDRLRFKDQDNIHVLLRELLQNELRNFTQKLDHKNVLKLLNSRFTEAQKLGAALLETNIDPHKLTLTELTRLVNHESQRVRHWACSICETRLSLLKQDMNKAARLLNTKWDDTREFVFRMFSEKLDKSDLRPEILVSICDSTDPAVTQLGCSLITRFFEDQDGPEYLLKLSEHPSPDMQMFATNYLEGFAAKRQERIAGLTPYFISVLSKINTGRVAKARVLHFLEKEALQDKAIAEVVAPIFIRQSLTVAVENKAAMIEAMLRLQDAYPDLDLPISVADLETRVQEASHAV